MKVLLLYKDHDFNPRQKLPWNDKELIQDLELNTLFTAMAKDDEFLFEVIKKTVLSCFNNDAETILYRQDILKDGLQNVSIIKDIYAIAVDAIEKRKSSWFSIFTKYPSSILSSSIGMMEIYVEVLKKLRSIADEHAGKFMSEGFTRFFEMLRQELTDEYFLIIQNHLQQLRFRSGILMSAQLGRGNKIIDYTLHKYEAKKVHWLQRLFAKKPSVYTFHIHPRDESGARALSELNNKGINQVANALAQSCDHIQSFFNMLRTELAFYIGCLNLQDRLTQIGEPFSFPVPYAPEERKHSFKELYDVCLALNMQQKVVGNDLAADNKNYVIITGANQGGKTTFLRSIGVAQIMMKTGMFVTAEFYQTNICSSLFTHFKREEDSNMKSGKLDEELGRMNDIADHLTSGSMLLFNESFAATNEREGSEIARQIVTALCEKGVKVFFVTHLYDFPQTIYNEQTATAVFLRAERQEDTVRTFKLKEGKPLPTSYGVDVYDRIFGET